MTLRNASDGYDQARTNVSGVFECVLGGSVGTNWTDVYLRVRPERGDGDDPDGIVYARLVNVLSHGNYSLFEPQEMLPENKQYFRKILKDFMTNYRFNPELFPKSTQ